MRTPAKQAELADVAARLAKFKPTKIALEANPERADFGYPKYESFTPEMLTQKTDERVQIAFRLAHKLGLKIVYAIDEQSDTIDYFPFERWRPTPRSMARLNCLRVCTQGWRPR